MQQERIKHISGLVQPWTPESVIEFYGGHTDLVDVLRVKEADNYHRVVIESALVLASKGMTDWQYHSSGGSSALWTAPNGKGMLRVWIDGTMT